MTPVDKRTIANRENAKKSTGPRTEDGKKRSRANAFKHGLSGSAVAWPGEQEGELRAFVKEQVEADPAGPRDARENLLMERVAGIHWQIDRVERAEEAHAAIRASRAVADEILRRSAEVARLATLLEDDPARAVQGLLLTREGCAWIADALNELIDAVDADWWVESHTIRLDALCAPVQPGRLRVSWAKALGLALSHGEYGAIWPNGIPGFEDEDAVQLPREEYLVRERASRQVVRDHKPKWRAELRAILVRRLAEVEALRDHLRAQPDPGLEYAGLAATFDHSEAGERLRRHIRARERERARLQAELDAHRARIEDLGAADEVREPEPQPEPAAETPPVAPEPEPPTLTADDSVRNDRGYGLTSPTLTEKWVRFAESQDAPEPRTPREPADRKNL